MEKIYPSLNPNLQEAIDTRIYVDEVDRLLDKHPYPKDDARLQHVKDCTLQERIDFLREHYATDMKTENKYKWNNRGTFEVYYSRFKDLDENLTMSGRVQTEHAMFGGRSVMEQLAANLNLPYTETVRSR